MGIKLRNCDSKSELRSLRVPFRTDTAATGTQLASIIVPVESVFKGVDVSFQTGVSACAGNALHTVVASVQRSSTLIDNTVTGTVSAIGANVVLSISATSLVSSPKLDVLTINLSASSNVGIAHGYCNFEINVHKVK
jgi:hypothetical protein